MTDKCYKCFNSRFVFSENGIHPVCTLNEFDAVRCMTQNYSLYSNPLDFVSKKQEDETPPRNLEKRIISNPDTGEQYVVWVEVD